ncbi:MAG TPA: alpha/beta hydrolase [Bradyrhizobium sp.]|uniref:alpha/beta fold hydrolase n=1 Tax=Bradyrhizobium sp. TaxID=376 RepID=UPI002BC8E337|nr:alpha/beta hydrolase [Bradyrhizobium sp.]HLZ01373.1 alpha/beta hydrolase [Bradyrhizobium sp.]
MTKILFLPGAGASASFWRPVADLLDPGRERHFFAWPGLGNEPHDPKVQGVDDLVSMVLAELDGPCDLIAQSLGGLVAIRVALSAPKKVRRLVLAVTSGGVPVRDLGGIDWRIGYRREFPNAAGWITDANRTSEDLSAKLGSIDAPSLLIWGDADPISPPSVGQRLHQLLPHARLRIIRGGGHDLAQTHAGEVATLIADHLR